jgi:hypothetical protein
MREIIQHYKRHWWIFIVSFIFAAGQSYGGIPAFLGSFVGSCLIFTLISLFIKPKKPKS